MIHGMGDQCLTDLGALKHVGLTYLKANRAPLDPPIGKKEDKSDRGFNHPQIAWMLCPCKKLVSFDEDPDVQVPTSSLTQLLTCYRIMEALQDGLINTSASNWPTIFYEDNVYDPDDRLKGLFCGHATFRVSPHMRTGLLLIDFLPVLCAFIHWTLCRHHGYCHRQHIKAFKEPCLGPY